MNNLIFFIFNILLINAKIINYIKDDNKSINNVEKRFYSKEEGYYLDTEHENSLIYCNSDMICNPSTLTNGYFINSINKNIAKCSDSNCQIYEKVSCSSNQVDIINNGGKLAFCFKGTLIDLPKSSDQEKYYTLSNIDSKSIFPIVSSGSNTILLKLDQYSVTQYITDSNGICINNNSNDTLCASTKSTKYICPSVSESCTQKKNTCDPTLPTNICNGYYFVNDYNSSGSGILYECIKGDRSTCEPVSEHTRGYFKEIDIYYSNHKYIKCDGTACVQIKTPSSSVTKCKTIGELILNNSEVKLCITSSLMKGFIMSNDDSFYIIENINNNIFGSEDNGDYVMISFIPNAIISKDLSENSEFSEGLSFEPNNIQIYHCEDSICSRYNAYIKYNNFVTLNCTKTTCNKIESIIDCTNSTNNGISFCDSDTKFKICLNIGDSTTDVYIAKEIHKGSKSFLFSLSKSGESTYKIFTTDLNGYMISLLETNNNYYLDMDEDSTLDMMVCSNGSCKKAFGPGYYLSYINEIDFYLYYCKDYNNCNKKEDNNGYYVNSSDNTIVKCIENNCVIFKNDASTCNYHYYEIIKYTDNKTYYCNSNKRVSFPPNQPYYFKINNYNTSSLYPNYNQGLGTILIKMDYYSVEQFTTDSNGVCINEDNILDESCSLQNEKKYICLNKSDSCETSANICDPTNPTGSCIGYFMKIDSNTNNLNLYQCDIDGEPYCNLLESVRGFYKLSNTEYETDQYVKCNGNSCELYTIPNLVGSECSVIGDLIINNSDVKFCIQKNILVGFETNINEKKNYIIENVQNNIFTSDTSSDYIMVTVSYNTITLTDLSEFTTNTYLFDNIIYSFTNNNEGKIIIKKLNESGIVTFYNDGLNNLKITKEHFEIGLTFDYSTLSLLDCDEGRCIRTSGFIKYNKTTLVKCTENQCEIFTTKVTCDSSSIGEAFLDSSENNKFKICINFGDQLNNKYETKTIENESTYFTFIESSASNYNLYKSDKNGNSIGLALFDGNYLVDVNNDNTKELIICNANNNGNICSKSKNVGYYLTYFDPRNLIYCDASYKCTKSTLTDGFFINSLNMNVIKCSKGTCQYIIKGKSCLSNPNDVILNTNKLYYCNDKSIIEFTNKERYYELNGIQASSKYPIIKEGSDIILLKIDKYSVTQYITNEKGICIEDDYTENVNCSNSNNNKYICTNILKTCTKDTNICNPKSPTIVCKGYYLVDMNESTGVGSLYLCNNDGNNVSCSVQEKPRGFFVVTDTNITKVKYIKCNGMVCQNFVVTETANVNCTIGNLVENKEKIKFCVNNNNMIAFPDEGEVLEYLITNTNQNVFGTTENKDYIIIQITHNSIIPKKLSNIKTNQYLIDNIVYTFTNTNGVISIELVKISGIYSFYYDDSIGYTTLISNNEFKNGLTYEYSKLRLLECKYGQCIETLGYLKYNQKTIVYCSFNDCKESKTSTIDCNNINNDGIAFLDSNSKFKICINNGNKNSNDYISKEINSSTGDILMFSLMNQSELSFRLYISNKNGYIVGLSLIAGYYFKDIDNNINVLLICDGLNTGNICKKSNKPGYYLNNENSTLMNCDDIENCQISKETDGYFINSYDYNYIKCSKSKCNLINSPPLTCNNNQNEVISHDNQMFYCHGKNEITFSTTKKYYAISEIKASSRYPIIEKGNDTILILISQFSIIQVTTPAEGFCISEFDHTEDSSCTNVNNIIYTCLKLDESCTIETNICNPEKSSSICNYHHNNLI
ncbi:hypothetical protein PIROE2DRAFT_17026 [Piromyces sp. E2]|nr:hypothetical protein PIROE2DRAFT_17026 [Piromyces sp. E2]|eukprot:OUM57859.1 hypothetical protein PIROE2DRAFT_17026 [Piromyces sp. E2]